MSIGSTPGDRTALLTLSQVAAIFGVEPATVTRWARAGKLPTINGECDFPESQIRALINGDSAYTPNVSLI